MAIRFTSKEPAEPAKGGEKAAKPAREAGVREAAPAPDDAKAEDADLFEAQPPAKSRRKRK